MFRSARLLELGRAADAVCRRLHPEPYRTYNIDRNINYTNVCAAVCDFCAFYRKVGDAEAYVLDRDVLLEKIRETVALGGDQILMQGGCTLTSSSSGTKSCSATSRPTSRGVNVHGFSPPEIYHFTKVAKLPLAEVLERLKAAGLGSLPGGGGEILVDRVRKAITRGKVLTDDWLNVHRVWHELGGPVDGDDDVRPHRDARGARRAPRAGPAACRTRPAASRRSSPGRSSPSTPTWPTSRPPGRSSILKNQAISRLYLDNVPNIQSSWVTQGPKIGQLALYLRRQRHGEPDDRGERRLVGGDGLSPVARGDQAGDPRGGLHSAAAECVL